MPRKYQLAQHILSLRGKSLCKALGFANLDQMLIIFRRVITLRTNLSTIRRKNTLQTFFIHKIINKGKMIHLRNTMKYSQRKPDLRVKYITIRRNFIHQEGALCYSKLKRSWASLISNLDIGKLDKPAIIGSYISIPDKQIIPPHLEEYKHAFPYFKAKKTLVKYPKMEFKEYASGDEYIQRVYGIKVPSQSKPTVIPSIVLVPLTCFNPISKQRIGNGGGYYDQYMEESRSLHLKAIFVGVAYECHMKKVSILVILNMGNRHQYK